MFIQCWSLFIKLFLLLLLINKILCQFQCDNGFDFETNLLLNPSNFTCGQSYHNISILDRFQLDLPDFDKVFSHQEEQFNLEEQIRKQFRSGSRNLCPLPNIQCERSRYRTIEGTCNNLVNPRLGSAGHCVPRLLPPVYADGVSAVKISITGRPLPNARIVSLLLHSAPKPPSQLNSLFMVYGQFLDHDIVLTPAAQSRSEKDSKWCYPIRLPIDDPFYSKFGQKCMEFVRSAACLSCEWGPRYQLNKITAFIDASTIYGSTLNESQSLRMLDGSGTLKVSEDSNGRPLLADSLSPENDGCSFPARGIYCFRSGDTRVNQQPPITSIHTIWHRHHNLIARGLKDLNSHWDEERLFQEARRIVAAQVQVVTYKEWLPLVLGPVLMKHFRLNLYNSGYTLYDPSKDPSILSEFSTAAFRFGHGTIRGAFARVESNGSAVPYRLKDNFFKAYILRNGTLDSIIRGLMEEQSSATGPGVDEDVRNHVYQTSMAKFGGDLIAINIQRGRDHAIPGYTSLFKYCHSKEISDWNQLSQLMDPSQVEKYRSIYAHIDDIDLFSGGLSEYPLPNAVVGPTFACILGKQFNHLRFGDRFWFEHSGMDGAFTEGKVAQFINTTRLIH